MDLHDDETEETQKLDAYQQRWLARALNVYRAHHYLSVRQWGEKVGVLATVTHSSLDRMFRGKQPFTLDIATKFVRDAAATSEVPFECFWEIFTGNSPRQPPFSIRLRHLPLSNYTQQCYSPRPE